MAKLKYKIMTIVRMYTMQSTVTFGLNLRLFTCMVLSECFCQKREDVFDRKCFRVNTVYTLCFILIIMKIILFTSIKKVPVKVWGIIRDVYLDEEHKVTFFFAFIYFCSSKGLKPELTVMIELGAMSKVEVVTSPSNG